MKQLKTKDIAKLINNLMVLKNSIQTKNDQMNELLDTIKKDFDIQVCRFDDIINVLKCKLAECYLEERK